MRHLKDIGGQPMDIGDDSNPYRLADGLPPRVVVQGENFFLELSPDTALEAASQLIRAALSEQRKVRAHEGRGRSGSRDEPEDEPASAPLVPPAPPTEIAPGHPDTQCPECGGSGWVKYIVRLDDRGRPVSDPKGYHEEVRRRQCLCSVSHLMMKKSIRDDVPFLQVSYCLQCGHANHPDWKTCGNCAARLKDDL